MTVRNLLRTRDGHHAPVSFAELFFDLVFVFAITQLSHSLLAHQSVHGFVETGMLFLAVWWTWIFTAWATNWLNPAKTPVRILLFALMAAGLGVSIAIPHAFAERGLLFALAFAGMQVGRALFMIAALQPHDRANTLNFVRITLWCAFAAIFWIGGGLADEEARMAWWGAALLIEYAAPILYFRVPGLGASTTSEWNVEGAHVAERAGLFVIIALGESILITGATFAEAVWDGATLAGFASAFLGTIAMWWLYFNIGAERGSHSIAHHDDPGRVARLAYTYAHIPIGAGIVLTAASDEMVLAHPHGHTAPLVAFCIVGGPALYLFGNLLFKHATAGMWQLSHLVGLALFAALGVAALALDPLTLSFAGTAILILVAGWETASLGGKAKA